MKILPSPSVLLKGMENSVIGVWSSHGEGKAHFPHSEVLQQATQQGYGVVNLTTWM